MTSPLTGEFIPIVGFTTPDLRLLCLQPEFVQRLTAQAPSLAAVYGMENAGIDLGSM